MTKDYSVEVVNLPHTIQKEPSKPVETISRREYFAAMAMQGLLSAIYSNKEMLNEFTTDKEGGFRRYKSGCEAISQNAVSYADALIDELDKKEK